MRSLHTLLLTLLWPCFTFAGFSTNFDRQSFIDTYANIAVVEMTRTGIPASITLAQAILESNWGQGSVAMEGNNFFCIKCNNGWQGPSIQAPDDEIGLSCFRAYASVEESFIDHSDFLTGNLRYQKLFLFDILAYRDWANGLQECGYATDPSYAEKLIRIIEENGLSLYDYAVPVSRIRILETAFETEGQGVENLQMASALGSSARLPFENAQHENILEVPGYRLSAETPAAQASALLPLERLAPEEISEGGGIQPLLPNPVCQVPRR